MMQKDGNAMHDKQNRNEIYVVTFSDFLSLLKKHRRKIGLIIAICTILGVLWALTRPLEYLTEASFKERGMATPESMGKNVGLLLGKKSSERQSEARTWFTSYTLLKKLAIALNLHAEIYPKRTFLINFPSVIGNNLKIEYAHYRGRPSPYLQEPHRPLKLVDVEYEDELPLFLEISFPSESTYRVTDSHGKEWGIGSYDIPFRGGGYAFTVHRDREASLEYPNYEIVLHSPHRVAEELKKAITIKNDTFDEEVVHLSTIQPDRYRGANLLNTLIALYKVHKTKEQRRISEEQLSYLEERQNEAEKTLRKAMDDFAYEQSKDFETHGFVNTERALEFLTTRLQDYQRRLLAIDLENKRLEKVMNQGDLFYERYIVDGDSTVIGELLQEIRKLKQQGDSIKLSLQETPPAFDDSAGIAFDRQMGDLEDTQQLIMELRAIDRELENNHLIPPSDTLINDPRILLHSWYEKLKGDQKAYKEAQLSPSEWENRKLQFGGYIRNLIQLFSVHEKAMRERLAHHGDLKEEFKGIDLHLANELFISYNRALNETETQLVKLQFILDSLQQPKFELNSLASHLNDSISNNLITLYSKLLLDLQDNSNRSQKEQERIRDELLRQRKFLEMHMTQSIGLLHATANLQKNKIHSLQTMTLALIQLKISLLENQVEHFFANRINNLKNEKFTIEELVLSVKREMAAIPEKKISEQLMQQRLEQSRDFGREITRLVESKNITNNLEVVLSQAVDEAIAPLFPRRPQVLFFAFLGMAIGTVASLFYYCLIEAMKGVAATPENLTENGFFVAGMITAESDALPVFRKVIQKIATEGKEPISVIGYGSLKVAERLAQLLSKRGDSTLIVALSSTPTRQGSCLMDFLERGGKPPSALKCEDFDYIGFDRTSPFSAELIASERFAQFMETMVPLYRWVLCVSDTAIATSEGEQLFYMYKRACILLRGERIEEIQAVLDRAKCDKERSLAFIFFTMFYQQ